MIGYLDWINVLTYDFHGEYSTTVSLFLDHRTMGLLQGSWEATSNHHAPLYSSDGEAHTDLTLTDNVDTTIQAYLDGGAPANKLVMGVPLYGRGWKGMLFLSSPAEE
jgi:chitinase